MLNEQFLKAVKAVKAIDSKGKGLFNALRDFVIEIKATDAEALRGYFKAQEQYATTLMKVSMSQNSTYKVAKGKLLKAVELGVRLTDSNGKLLGKSALEDAIKAAEGPAAPKTPTAPATPFDQCMVAISVLAENAAKVVDKDIAMIAGPVQTLLDQLVKRIPVPIAA